MINNTKALYSEKVKSLAKKYESQGFRVFSEPKTDELPLNLGNYQPDMIAIKDGSGLVIEIKTSLSRVSVDRLQALAEEVSKHPGWRFLLVTLEDIEAKLLPGTSEQLPSWQNLVDRFNEAHRLIESDEIEQAFKAAFLLLWSTFEGALRKRAVDVSIPIERFPVIGLLKHMYSLGELSISQFDFAQSCFEAWNSFAHGYIQYPYSKDVLKFHDLVSEVLDEWRTDSPEDSPAFVTLELAKDLMDYVDAKVQKIVPVVEPTSESPDIDLINDSFIGMWRDRQDLTDSNAWVRSIRENQW